MKQRWDVSCGARGPSATVWVCNASWEADDRRCVLSVKNRTWEENDQSGVVPSFVLFIFFLSPFLGKTKA